MPSSSGPCVIQVTNISPAVTKDQLNAFFSFIGGISALHIYPEQEDSRFPSKVAYIKFNDSESVDIALHLQNTVFNDRALFIQPFSMDKDGKFPSEKDALAVAVPQDAVFGILPKTKSWPARVTNLVVGQAPNQQIVTIDPKLSELGLSSYPPLNYESTDTSRIEDIRKTIYVSNLDPSISCDQITEFFARAGEVKCARMTVNGSDGLCGCYVEFNSQDSVAGAITCNGCAIGGRSVRVIHATQAIDRPSTRRHDDHSDDSNSRSSVSDSLEDGMRRMRDAHAQITRCVEEEIATGGQTKPKGPYANLTNVPPAVPVPVRRQPTPTTRSSPSRSRRSRSRSKSRSRSRHRYDRRRSRRSRSRSRSRDKRRRSGERRKDRKRSKSKSPPRDKRKDRKRSKSRDKRDRSRDRKASKKDRRSSRDRSKSRDKRRSKKDDKKERKSKRSRSRSREKESKKSRRRSRSRSRGKPEKKKSEKASEKVKAPAYKDPGDEPHEPEQLQCGEPVKETKANVVVVTGDNREEVPMDTSSTSHSSNE